MNRTELQKYFELLEEVLTELSIKNKPSHIFNVDETGLKLNNSPNREKVVAEKNTSVQIITSCKKGGTISVICCVNAKGQFYPPFCVFKGKNYNEAYKANMPVRSQVKMNPQFAYVNSQLFHQRLQTHFLPKKPNGKLLLILNDHTSHLNVDLLHFAFKNDVGLLCLLSHCTHYLQPLDKSFFTSLKTFTIKKQIKKCKEMKGSPHDSFQLR